MIAHDVSFIQAESVTEALAAWQEATDAGLRARYFSGGTELITRARDRAGEYDVLIDIKRIPECSILDPGSGAIGSAVRLSALTDQNQMPLLAAVARGIADRTARNSITFGGNICSVLPYRETLLPVLLVDGDVFVAGPSSPEPASRPVSDLFERRLRLEPGEFVVSVHAPSLAGLTGYYRRRTRDARVDYPIVSVVTARVSGRVRLAIGGAYGYPVRSAEAEAAIAATLGASSGDRPDTETDTAADSPEAAEFFRRAALAAVDAIPDRTWDDMRAGAEYRRELLVQTITDGLVSIVDGGRSAREPSAGQGAE
jgi:CO/xanthine dehydrogenase FAD-binding subunit